MRSLLVAISKAVQSSGFYIGCAVCGIVLVVVIQALADAQTIGANVLSVLVFFYFIAYPLLCIFVKVLLEYRAIQRVGELP